ncbi:hypothetical protein I4U23_017287 [Adineta vaga]|nr:hypothetical protein I4U23_017287 [Adineta vaga]
MNKKAKLAATGLFQHSGNRLNGEWMGENLFAVGPPSTLLYSKGGKAVTGWYSEIAKYNWTNPGFSYATGHFTQVVWKNTKTLGIGRAMSKTNNLYVVGNYFPGGDFAGAFNGNVLPLC